MTIRLTFFMCFIILSCLFADREVYPQGEHRAGREQAIEDYEKEKLAKFKQNIGRRLLTVKTINPAEFYESPYDLARKLNIKREKEGFVIVEVVQNQLGTMNFYQVKFDTGQIGYLSADGNYLQIKIKEGSLISVSRRGSEERFESIESPCISGRGAGKKSPHSGRPCDRCEEVC